MVCSLVLINSYILHKCSDNITGGLLDHLSKQIKETDNSGVWRHLVGFKNLLRSIECYGIASVHGINYFGRGALGYENYVAYIRNDILGRDLLNGSLYYVPALKLLYKNLTRVMPDYGHLRNWYASRKGSL